MVFARLKGRGDWLWSGVMGWELASFLRVEGGLDGKKMRRGRPRSRLGEQIAGGG
jgi:hypothetical protein